MDWSHKVILQFSQKKAPPNHYWPEPEPGRGALWLKKGEYDGVRQMYDEERKKEFVHDLEKRQQQVSLEVQAK